MQEKVKTEIFDIFCDKCGEYLGSYVSGTQAKCPDCLIYSSSKINNLNNRKEDTR